ncbi:hypothetical protein [Clostridium beijerinckii]|nr:hypothetical protein [Clostridium beijerinckii]MBA8933693.1 GGDEF domain-containing protein [Clostridium beijerinckii]NRT36383.1 GGDEF domain-containing protein [Clostridium beijerinckii]NRT44188.1 GGDEF domain-containing protein [Clostridium beijerinckii]NRT73047.1 GGDEF domain-containing protein [Clostridium beijerinckii]NRZ21819.1 GGDEF domain-containing protein [Clostridium beijerinckii]
MSKYKFIKITISIGIASYPNTTTQIDNLLEPNKEQHVITGI